MTFHDLATRAALGTANRHVSPTDLPPAVAGVLGAGGEAGPAAATTDPATTTTDPAVLLLDAAAAYAVALRTRIDPGPDAPPLDLPVATRPVVSPQVVGVLHRLRAESAVEADLLSEALRLVAERGLTLPPTLALDLLRGLGRQGPLPALLARTLDERMAALARLRPEWAHVTANGGRVGAPPDPRVWDEGTVAERAEYLRGVREADPAAGRALLEALTWTKEPVATRELFVGVLTEGLSGQDEGFLERALDDRAKAVRAVAARLLARLPGSAYVARAEALVTAHLTVRKRLLRGPAVEVTRVGPTASTERDGYPAGQAGGADPLELLRHAFVVVPTHRWPALVGYAAADLATAPAEYDGHPVSLRPAWAEAARAWGDADLAQALSRVDESLLGVLVPLLPDAGLADLVRRRFRDQPAHLVEFWQLPERFGPEVTRAVTGLVEAWTGDNGLARFGAYLPSVTRRLAVSADPAQAAAVAALLRARAERLPEDQRAVTRALWSAAAALDIRAALAEQLAPYPVVTRIPEEG